MENKHGARGRSLGAVERFRRNLGIMEALGEEVEVHCGGRIGEGLFQNSFTEFRVLRSGSLLIQAQHTNVGKFV